MRRRTPPRRRRRATARAGGRSPPSRRAAARCPAIARRRATSYRKLGSCVGTRTLPPEPGRVVGDAPVVWRGRRLRQAVRRVFVYLPLVGENEDGDEDNERAREGKPRKRLHGNACACRRHRAFTLPGVRPYVKSDKRTKPLTLSARPFTVEADDPRGRP